MDRIVENQRRTYRIGSWIVIVSPIMQASAFATYLLPRYQTGTQPPISPQSEVRQLEVGKPIERELRGGESHAYDISLSAGQYANVVVEQRGIDVVVRVIGPAGKQVTEADRPFGTMGPESVRSIAELPGTYRCSFHKQKS